MQTDVLDLRDFYASSLGLAVRRIIRPRLRALWPDVAGQRLLGYGFTTPFLRPFRGEAERVVAVMPAQMGVMRWPTDAANATCIAHEGELPFADLSFERILLVHALEGSDSAGPMLREIWRVLADGGRMLVVVPNRRSIWARMDHTPFGYGQPYSMGQLTRFLREQMFDPARTGRALYVPPSRRRFILGTALAWENLGARWFQPLAGVHIVEATKLVYGGAAGYPGRRRRYLVLGSAGPEPR